ncbi:MAG: ribonuclease III [Firmicutes bacterium]|nr:ribonuclease III [Bacillota bacterium]
MTDLEQALGHVFRNRELLETALTHSSYANEKHKGAMSSNERLEFLGDSVLGHLTADYLYRSCPDMPEGGMTRLRAELVCEQNLLRVARELSLGEQLKLGRGEEMTGGRARPSILADAVEALIAALYLDGGIEAVRAFVREYILSHAEEGNPATEIMGDYKTVLQELVQRSSGRVLSYETLSESGPEHNKRFVSEVRIDNKPMGKGSGRSKKESEQAAAREALKRMGE